MATQADGDEAVAWPDDAVEVGRVTDAWGIKGWIRVQPYASEPEALFSSRRWFIRPPEGAGAPRAKAASTALPPVLRITHAQEHGGTVIAAAQQLPDRNAAEAMRGARVFVSRGSFPTPAAEEFYWIDLIGLDVVNREGVQLGRVVDLIDTGVHSVLRVAPASPEGAPVDPAAERLIPFVAAYVDTVDQAARRITVDWGLDY